MPKEERDMPLSKKTTMLLTSVIPPIFLIFAVLGSILFGVATPTEAAAVGTVGAIIVTFINRQFTWKMLKDAVIDTAKIYGMLGLLIIGSDAFMGVFMGLGGRQVVGDFLLGLPLGDVGIIIATQVVLFVLGMFIGPVPIILLCVPLFAPVVREVGLTRSCLRYSLISTFKCPISPRRSAFLFSISREYLHRRYR